MSLMTWRAMCARPYREDEAARYEASLAAATAALLAEAAADITAAKADAAASLDDALRAANEVDERQALTVRTLRTELEAARVGAVGSGAAQAAAEAGPVRRSPQQHRMSFRMSSNSRNEGSQCVG